MKLTVSILREWVMSKEYKEAVDSTRLDEHTHCIADEMTEQSIKSGSREDYKPCGSSDAQSVFENEYADGSTDFSAYCHSCGQAFQQRHLSKSSLADELGLDSGGVIIERKVFTKKPKQPKITKEQVKEVVSYGYGCELRSGPDRGKPIRNIKEKYNKFFGHITKKDKNGNPTVRLYPETSEGSMMGYKSRTFLGKHFGYENAGITGIKNDLSGQVKFKDMQFRDICIVGGEEDKVAFFQQFDEYQERRFSSSDQEFAPMPVVSPTTGEGSAVKQIRDQYDFVNRGERIFIGMDNDEAGRKAAAAIAAIFPKEKVFIITWSYKDPNNAINNKEGKDYSAQTIRDFYNAKPYFEDGVKSSKDVMGDVAEVLLKERISLPPYMSKIAKMMGGDSGESGMLQNVILNVIGNTSCGKTTHTNGMCYHWFMTSPQKPIVASLEATAGQYALDIISIHLGENVRKGRTGREVLEYLNTPEVQERLKDLWENEYGEERFRIIDEREGDIKCLERQLEDAFNRDGCQLFIIDVLTDILRNLSIEQQSEHMSWQKNMVKRGATIVNVLHTTKPKRDKEGKMIPITEYCAYGSSTFVQSAAINILIDRDKMTEDGIEKNTTRVRMPKCREGHTGDAGEWYYDVDTRGVHDRDKFFRENPDKLPTGYDLKANPYSQEDTGKFSKKAGGGKSEPEVIKMEVPALEIVPEKLPTMG